MLENEHEKIHATRVSNKVFLKHKYLTNPALTPADSIVAAATAMAAQLKGHMTRHIAANKLQALRNLHAIFDDAANASATDTPEPVDCCVIALLTVDTAGPKEKNVITPPPVQRPILSLAPPPRVACAGEETPTPQQVPPRPAAEGVHLPPQAPETALRHRVLTTPAASWRESPGRSQGP